MLHALFGASRFGNDDPSTAESMSERGDEIGFHCLFATRAMIDAVTFFRAGGIDLFDKFALCVTERGNFDFGRIGATFMRTMLVRFPTGFGTSRRLGLYENDIVSGRRSVFGLQNGAAFGTKYCFYAFIGTSRLFGHSPLRRRRVRDLCNSLIGRVITTRASVVFIPTEFGASRRLIVVVDKVVTERINIFAVEFGTANGTKQCVSARFGASRRFSHSPFVGSRVRQQRDIFAFKLDAASGTKQRQSAVFGTSGFFGYYPFACRRVSERGKDGYGQIGNLILARFVQEVHIAICVEPIFDVTVFGTSRSERFGLDKRAELDKVNGYGTDLQILLRTEGYVVRIDIFYGDSITFVGNDNVAFIHIRTVRIVFTESDRTNDLFDQSSVFCGNVNTAVVTVGASAVTIACLGNVNVRILSAVIVLTGVSLYSIATRNNISTFACSADTAGVNFLSFFGFTVDPSAPSVIGKRYRFYGRITATRTNLAVRCQTELVTSCFSCLGIDHLVTESGNVEIFFFVAICAYSTLSSFFGTSGFGGYLPFAEVVTGCGNDEIFLKDNVFAFFFGESQIVVVVVPIFDIAVNRTSRRDRFDFHDIGVARNVIIGYRFDPKIMIFSP